jgi:multidrug efflux pump subunit AcrA (membrane-fusion protein)
MTNKRHCRIPEISTALLPGALCFQLASCGHSSAGAAQPTPPDVEVVTVEQNDIPVYREWIGTLDGMVNAAIRAQVTGYLLTQDYSEGSFVKKGQLLFQIDPRPLQAAADQARGQRAQANGQLEQAQAQYQQSEAQLASAEANQHKAQFDEDRYTPLAKEHAVTQQDLDNAVQNNISAKAQVKVVYAPNRFHQRHRRRIAGSEGADLIFEPFHTTKPQGTGMGLTITRSIIESYGGRVWASANQGSGATFHFTLPTGAEAHA